MSDLSALGDGADGGIARRAPKRKGRPRRVRYDFRVDYLALPIAWRVGRATFRPPGWLRERVERETARVARVQAELRDFYLEGLNEWPWASASVTTKHALGQPPNENPRELASDAVAVARLYQRACLPGWSVEHQTFGLATSIDSKSDWTWRSDYTGSTGITAHRYGNLGGWTVTRAQVRGFRDRAAFAFLDDALQVLRPVPGSWQQRAISAVRALDLGSPMQPQSLRIVLQAVALEALLGDDPIAEQWKARPQAHPVAQRAAFLTCEADGSSLAPGDAGCYLMTAASAGKAEVAPNDARRPAGYWDWPCTSYWHIRQLFDARNQALHDAQDHFPTNTAMRFERRVDDVILATLDWVASTGAQDVSRLDTAINALPKAPKSDAPASRDIPPR